MPQIVLKLGNIHIRFIVLFSILMHMFENPIIKSNKKKMTRPNMKNFNDLSETWRNFHLAMFRCCLVIEPLDTEF